MNIGKISAVTIPSPDLSQSVEQYIEFLNYRLVEEGQVSKEEAIAWKAENIEGADYVVLQPENSNDFAFRFIKQEIQGEYIPFKTSGWNAAEIIVRNVDEMAIKLSNSDFEIIGPPADLSFTDQIRAMQVIGPSMEILYLTEFKSKLPEFDSPIARCDVDQTFIVILAGSSMDQMQEFYCDSFNLERAVVMDSRIRAISRVFGNPEDTKYKSAAIPIKDQCLIEIDELPDGAAIRSSEPGYLLPGISMVSFLAYDNVYRDSLIYHCNLTHLKGRKCSIIHGNEQEIIELVNK